VHVYSVDRGDGAATSPSPFEDWERA